MTRIASLVSSTRLAWMKFCSSLDERLGWSLHPSLPNQGNSKMKVQIVSFLIVVLMANLACSLSTPPAPDTSAIQPSPTQALMQSRISTEIAPTRPAGSASANVIETCQVNTQALNLRECGNITCRVVNWLQIGQQLIVMETSGEWLKVQTPDGKTGWVNGKYCGGQP